MVSYPVYPHQPAGRGAPSGACAGPRILLCLIADDVEGADRSLVYRKPCRRDETCEPSGQCVDGYCLVR
jgi:hypothetical protein